MSVILIVGGVFVFIGAILFLVWWFSADQKVRRKIKSHPIVTIGQVREGEAARIAGVAESPAPLTSPLSGRPCVYYRVEVQEQRGMGRNRHWVKIIDEHDGIDFFVRDQTGKALVRTQAVHAVLTKDHNTSSGMFNDASPVLEEFLAARGHTSQGWVFNKAMRYAEGIVEPGETITVLGKARWEPDPDISEQDRAGYRERAKRLVLESLDDGPLLMSDERGLVHASSAPSLPSSTGS